MPLVQTKLYTEADYYNLPEDVRGPGSSWMAASSSGGDGSVKTVSFPSVILPVLCWGRGMDVMYPSWNI